MTTYYDILGISFNASIDEVKKAFRSKALKTHPDKKGGTNFDFQVLLQAYSILSNPVERALYDKDRYEVEILDTKKSSQFSFNEREKRIIESAILCTRNIFLHGPAGVGKTVLINEICRILTNKGKRVAMTATTGAAAINIKGSTLHSFAGIGLGSVSAATLYQRVMHKPKAIERWRTTDVLVIDEVSMLGGELFAKIEFVAQRVRGNKRPFGGIKLIMSGDLLQLPPINDKWIFDSDVWDSLDFLFYTLKESKRYKETEYFDMLLRIREGKHTKEDIEKLQSRTNEYKKIKKEIQKWEIKPTILYSKKADVHKYNVIELDKLPGEEIEFEAIDTYICDKLNDNQKEVYRTMLENAIPENISLKEGAQVMLRKNLDQEAGLVNGSRGVVKKINIQTGGVLVKFKNGSETWIFPEIWQFEYEDDLIIRQQIPLILAWSITAHKSQGATLDCVIADLGPSVFANSQAYVALSRVRDLNNLYLSEFTPSSIRTDPTSLTFINTIKDVDPPNPLLQNSPKEAFFDDSDSP